MKYRIDFEPIGRRVLTSGDMNLLSAAQNAGIDLAAVCGGVGVCGDCKIRLVTGELTAPTQVEKRRFSENELSVGWRLACQAYPVSDLKIEIPSESLNTSQRLQLEDSLTEAAPDPVVKAWDLEFARPSLSDLRSDAARFSVPFLKSGQAVPKCSIAVLRQFSTRIRQQDWAGRIIVHDSGQSVVVLPLEAKYYGLAVDIGTTKMAVFLVDLTNGRTVARQGVMNPQIAFGEDVVSRIAYANDREENRLLLQKRLVESLNGAIHKLCAQVGAGADQIVDVVVVGNTAMHHLFAGLSVRQLGQAPYLAAVNQAMTFPAHEIGLETAPGAFIYLPPNIAGYVGADHVAMLLASKVHKETGVALALDIGTNTEISLVKNGALVCCSCASGPAFEGAHLHAGIRAVPGAIERAQFYDGDWHFSTIDDRAPIGICGSGILDIVAALLDTGQIDSAGRFTEQALHAIPYEKGGALRLVSTEVSGANHEILVLRQDIREIQLAKAAIRAGINALLRATVTLAEDIDRFIIAGAFGTYLHLASAIRVGMFPKLPKARYFQIGNAAGAGARMMLLSQACRKEADEIYSKMSYLELTADPGFNDSFVDEITFEQEN